MARDNSTYSRSWVGTIGQVGVKPDPMVASNDAMKRFNQAFPVNPNRQEEDGTVVPRNDAAYAVMPPEYNPQTYVQAAATDAAKPAVEYKPPVDPGPVVDSSATEPRGPVSQAVGAQPREPAAGVSTVPGRPDARFELAMMAAKEQQAAQARGDAMRANANWAQAWTQQRDAESAARVANFRATNGADMVLRGGNPEQRQAILADQAAANARLSGANAALTQASNAPVQQRNFVQEAVTEEQMRDGRLNTAQARATGAITQQQQQLKLEEQKRINEVGSQLAAAKTPEERESLQQKLLAMLGKDPRDGTKVLPISMPDRTNEMGAVMKGGQGIVVMEPGKPPQIIGFGEGGTPQQGAGAPTQIPIAAVEMLKQQRNDPKAIAEFEAKYKVPASQYLSK